MKGRKMSARTDKKNFIILISCVACVMGIWIKPGNAQEDASREAETLSSFESRIDAIIQENTILKKRLKELISQSSGTNNSSAELQGSIDKLQEENHSLSVKLEGKSEELDALKRQIEGAEKEKDDTSGVKKKGESLEKEKRSLSAQLEEARKEKEALTSQIAALKDELAAGIDAKDKARTLQKEKDALSEQLGVKNKENEAFKNQIALLSEKLNANELEIAMLESMLQVHTIALRQPRLAQANEENYDKIIHQNLGFAYGMKGNIDEAIKEYRKVLECVPDDYDAHYNIGYLLGKKKAYKEAIEEYKKALKGLPEDKEVYYNLAIICTVGLKDLSAAQEFHQKFLSLSSADSNASPQVKEALQVK